MKILLTGGEGFIGKHLRNKIDCQVYDLVNGDDIRDKFKLDNLFSKEKFDIVINLAARAGVSAGEEYYEEFFSTNCIGLKTLIEVCKKHKAKLIHYSSSSAINARSIYGITKLAGEKMIENSGLDYVIIRPFTVIGKNGRKEMVLGKWLGQYQRGEKITFNGDGSAFRGYTYVEDLVDGTIMSLGLSKELINLGGNQKITLEELWEIFKEIYPKAERVKLPYPSWDEPGELADISRTKKLIGWEPKTDIKQKIKDLWT
jgi:nucleoside-diphosphate-sugar epimerase